MSDLLYQLNARDEISFVNEEWVSFALENQGEVLQPAQVVGRSLWDFIGDMETQHIYRLLHQRVRTDRTPVRFGFRCDAPALRRLLELEISGAADLALTYHVRTVREEERAPPPLLDPYRLRSERFVTMCGWCKRVAAPPRGWLEVEQAVAALSLFAEPHPPQLSHGICEECARALHAVLDGGAGDVVLGRL